LIEETLKAWIVKDQFLSRQINIKRTHYDLTPIFSEKLWFRKLLSKF
jgi:hypothetical protein